MKLEKEQKIVTEESNSRPNRIVAATMLVFAIACSIALLLCVLGVLTITLTNALIGLGIPTLIFVAPQFVAYNKKIICKKPVKYVFMGLFLIGLLILLTFLNFHAQMLLTIPITIASFYVSRKQTVIAYLGTVTVIVLYIVLATLLKTWDFRLIHFILESFGYSVIEPAELNTGNVAYMLAYIGLPEFVIVSAIEISVFRNIMHGKERLENQLKIEKLSTIDSLTGVQNRNSYEETLEELRKNPKMGIICIYADANGLHELNNTKGHEAGDDMIKFLAKKFVDEYGAENVYRTGGDEFVALADTGTWSQAKVRAVYIKDLAEANGYAVSIGLSQLKPNLTIDDIVKEAERNMFSDKSNYYIKNHIDRRRGK